MLKAADGLVGTWALKHDQRCETVDVKKRRKVYKVEVAKAFKVLSGYVKSSR